MIARILICLAAAWLGCAGPALAQDPYYEIETLNAGLPPAPESFDRDTPQGAVESFLDAAERGDFALAAHGLNLASIDPARQPEAGPRLARELAEILDRKIVISWRKLMERPDSIDATATSNSAMAGTPRRSILLGVLDRGRREGAVRLNRVKPADGPAVWVFSERTVELVPELYALHGPSKLEQSMPAALRDEAFWGLHIWEVIGLPIVLVIAAVTGWLLYRLFDRAARHARRRWTTVALAALRWPSIIAGVTTIILYATLKIFVVSGPAAAVLGPLTVFGYVAAVLIFGLQVIDAALDRLVTFDSDRLADPENDGVRTLATSMSAARRVLIVVGLLVAGGVTLAAANLYRTLGFSLLASAGALTLILGFAARRVLGNIMASLQIAMNRSARIGDQVIYNEQWCTVERINFTYIELKRWDQNRVIVPVEHFVSDSFLNMTKEAHAMIRAVVLTLAHGADVDALRERFLKMVEAREDLPEAEGAKVLAIGQDGFGLTVRFQFPCPDPITGWNAECDLREALMREAAEIQEETGRQMLPSGLDQMDAA